MVFQPANPTNADFHTPFPSWIIDAVPGAAEMDAAVAAAEKAVLEAVTKAATARDKRAALGGPDGPAAHVKRATWDKADDDARAAAAAREVATRAHDRAAKARYEFMYGPGDELGALHSDSFKAQAEPLYAEASRRAQEHLDALQAALTERDNFASTLGRTIEVDGGNFGLRDALSNVTAYVAAGMNDEDETAWDIVNDALAASYALTDAKLRVVHACQAVRADKTIPASAKADRYRAILARHGMSGRVIR